MLSSDEEDYQLPLDDEDFDLLGFREPLSVNGNNSANVPLLEVQSTGSLRSLALSSTGNESFLQYRPTNKCKGFSPLLLLSQAFRGHRVSFGGGELASPLR